jgi:diadenosine tetraphosphate (Ap4A) HIT family hydrolase
MQDLVLMTDFSLDPVLKKDCHLLGDLDSSVLLLMRNALFPWFVLVPRTSEIEFYRLDRESQVKVVNQINLVSRFIEETFQIDKLNIASIGNIVSQLHVHVVGRSRNDICWPGVVWGVQEFRPYESDQVAQIEDKLAATFPAIFRAQGIDG